MSQVLSVHGVSNCIFFNTKNCLIFRVSGGIYNLSQISKILVSHGEKPLENVSENAE